MHTSLPTTTWLALSAAAALFPSGVTAFYPYHYGSSSSSSDTKRTTPQSHLPSNANSRSLTLPLHRIPRQNSYNIITSTTPTQPNSVAIDQDGGDISYMIAVTFGDSKEAYHLLLDSAASNTWVMGQECGSDACKMHNTFGEGDSGTLKTETTPFNMTYGTGSVNGVLASDTLHIGASLSLPDLTFGLATSVSSEFSSYPMDGILGIGRGPSTTTTSTTTPPLIDALSTTNNLASKLYGIHLSRNTNGGKADGEMNFGALNTERFTGEINYLATIDNDAGFWEVQIADAGVHGNTTTLGLNGARTAIIDTGTSFILMPPPDALALHRLIPGFAQDGETFSVPCDTAAVVQFVFGQEVYNVSTADWVGGKMEGGLCRSNIVGRQTFGDTQWLVGDVFLKNVYSVFDFEKNRVGFGVLGEEEAAAAGESSTATSSSSATAGSTRSTQTGNAPASGTASSTAAVGSTPLGQGGAANRASASLLGLAVAGMMFSVCI